MSTVPSAAEQMRSIMLNRMNRNESDEKLDNAILVQLSTESATRIQDAAGKAAQSLTSTLATLEGMGFDKKSKVAKNQVSVNEKINDVLVKLAEAAARHAS